MVQLLGPDGLPIRRELLMEEQAGPTLMGIRRPNDHHPARGLTPQRIARILAEAEQGDPREYLALAEDMEERDLHYLSVIGTRKRQVAQLEITVESASDAAGDVKAADLVRDWLKRATLEDELFDVLDAVGKGYSLTELIWDFSERQWWPARLEHRDPGWFELDRTDLRTPMLRSEVGPQPLAPYKFIQHVHRAKSGLPIRGGLARAAAWAFIFKTYTDKDWAVFLEVYGQPLRLGKYNNSASEDEKKVLLRAVANIGTDAAAIIPETMLIEFVKADASGSGDAYLARCNFLDTQVSKAVLGQTATTDAIAGGHAVGKEHNEVREDIERADAKVLAATLQRDLIMPLVALNLGPQAKYPTIRIGRPETIELDKFVSAIGTLVPLGLKVGMSVVRDRLGIPEPDDSEEILAPPVPPPAEPLPGDKPLPGEKPVPGKPGAKAPPGRALHAAGAGAEDTDSIDELVAIALDGWTPMMRPVIDPVRTIVGRATSFEDLREQLAQAVQSMDVEALRESLARAGFAARIAGALGAPISDLVDPEPAGG